MQQPHQRSLNPAVCTSRYTGKPLAYAMALLSCATWAQQPPTAPSSADTAALWKACTHTDAAQRLACFDAWAAHQPTAQHLDTPAPALASNHPSPKPQGHNSTPHQGTPASQRADAYASDHNGCHNPEITKMSRFWELEKSGSCGRLQLRGYRPISISITNANNVNQLPTGEAADHTATTAIPYRRTENRLQLSVRTKLAQGLLVPEEDKRLDSLWFGYSQQSYWQLFSPEISRPFRTTDHEPEVMYVYPTNLQLPGGWKLRYAGVGLNHQSNGQSLPLSRSWNRTYLMAGAELDKRWRVTAKIWQRLDEKPANDDNPNISNFMGRAELQTLWSPDADNTFGLTIRHSLRQVARGSTKLEWLQTLGKTGWSKHLGNSESDLRLHLQLFSGYGDSLIDYNRRRTVFGIGLSLVDF